jgi:hypothetical protein
MAADPTTPPAPSAVRVALFSTAAGFMIGVAIVLYRIAWSRHAWPIGHPWPAVSVAGFVVVAYVGAFRSRVPAAGMGVAVVFAIAAMALWMSATT